MKFSYKVFFWLGLLGLYFSTRLINLKIIPIFTDEAIYTYWAQVALHDPANRFISLEDGKQPLFIWLAAISQKFIADPLIASRLISVLAGLGSTVGIYLLSLELFAALKVNLRVKLARIASFMYVILPFTLLYDRMALFDSLLTMFGIYAVLFSVRLAKTQQLENAILSGFAIGLATITKSSGIFFLYLFPFSLSFFDFRSKGPTIRFLKWLIYAFITFSISQIIYNSLRLSPLFYIISRKNLEFIRSFSEVIINPFTFFYSNTSSLISWTVSYTGLPLSILLVAAVVYGLAQKNRAVIYLSILSLVPFFAEVFFNKVLYPRFILFYFPYMILLVSFAISSILEKFGKYKRLIFFALILMIVLPLLTSFKLITNPKTARIPDSDRGQYLNDWPAGYGVSEIVDRIKRESQSKQVYVGTEGTFGLLPYALQIYFFANPNVHIIGFWPVDHNNLPRQILDLAQKDKAYFVFNENQKEIENPHLRFVVRYQKGIGNSFMRLFEIIPQ